MGALHHGEGEWPGNPGKQHRGALPLGAQHEHTERAAVRRGEPAADDRESAAAWHLHHVEDSSVPRPYAEHASVGLGGPDDALVADEELRDCSAEVSHDRVREGDRFDSDQRPVA